MSSLNRSRPHTAKIKSIQGFTLIEVLVTLVITAIALFGFVELQNRAQIANLEATQRAYATMIASNMAEQIKANPEIGADCNLTASFDVGSGHGTWNHPCESGNNSVKEWHKDLRGNRETTNSGNQKIGSIKNGHGCINYTRKLWFWGVWGFWISSFDVFRCLSTEPSHRLLATACCDFTGWVSKFIGWLACY
jgi:type IV pilus modification protein PilV